MRQPLIGRRLVRLCAVLAGAVVMSWPAIYNRYPLLYPDSVSYLGDGRPIARALFLYEFSDYYGFRSLIYNLGIWLLHWGITPWPVVAFNALLTAYMLWLLVRALAPSRTLAAYSGLVILLSLLTGLGWIVGWIMPDIFGPILYLAVLLFVCARDSLSVFERWAVCVIAWWSAASHLTHLMLAGGLCVVLLATQAIAERSIRKTLRPIGLVLAILAAAALSQVALNRYLNGELSLNSNRPPYYLARVVVDGPGRLYLQRHCGELRSAICAQLNELPETDDDFLWGENGWGAADTEQQKLWQREEMPVVLGTLREYPWEELKLSARHFREQFLLYTLYSYSASPWVAENMESTMPGQGVPYAHSRQAQKTLHEDFFSNVQEWTVRVSLVVIAAGLLIARRRMPRQLVALTVTVAFVVIANAAMTGILSEVDERYQSRVIWMVPMLAVLYMVRWLEARSWFLVPSS